MHNNEETSLKALLCALDNGEYDVAISLDELQSLAETAGIETIGHASQKRSEPDTATYIGSGKLEEIAAFAKAEEAELLIFDGELSGSQQRNIGKATGLAVTDRTTLILDIFAQRAHSAEGRLQVELAQLRYRLPRLAGIGHALSRQGGGGGGGGGARRGGGETMLETDRRHIRRRITALEEKLEKLEERRGLLRERRKKNEVATVAIVGYTNVGKSTLLNALTEAGVLAENKLFATLDPTARALTLPDGRQILLIDTVGLVSRLPHHLVKAFKSTLEEAAGADLVLNMCDATAPNMEGQLEVTRSLLTGLGAEGIPMLTVVNKCDALEGPPPQPGSKAVYISARTGHNLEGLLSAIVEELPPAHRRLTMVIPYSAGGLLAEIRKNGKILQEEFIEEGMRIEALVDTTLLYKVQDYLL